jgi:alpha-beta hydrolase superfamily lysophospholipase
MSKKTMPAKDGEEAATAATAATCDPPNLPPGFMVGTFVNSRSQSLFTINLPPKEDGTPSSSSSPRAMLVLAYGIGEHCCQPGYVRLCKSLSGAGVDVYGFDHHGHGRSDSMPRGYANKFDN